MTTKQSTHIPTPAMIEEGPLGMLRRRRLDALSQGGSAEIDVNELDWAIEALEEAAREPTPNEDVVERLAPFEEIVIEAYKRGWDEGVHTLLEDCEQSLNPEAPHPDARGEGCGTFMGEAWPRLLASIKQTTKDRETDRRDALYDADDDDLQAWLEGR